MGRKENRLGTFLRASSLTMAISCVSAPFALAQGVGAPAADLDQNWTQDTRRAWYTATQGSRLIPESWLRALEQPGSTRMFLEAQHIASFGYLPLGPNTNGPLPVGFALDKGPDTALTRTKLRWKTGQGPNEAWVGLNCAACHTNDIKFRGQTRRIDGASTTANFKAMLDALNASLRQTKAEPARWARFSASVVGANASLQTQQMLRAAFDQFLLWQQREASINETTSVYGPGRVDAFGRIYNKVALLLDPQAKGNPPDAPVSIPHIWRAPQYDKVQYNGIAPKVSLPGLPFDFGALGRNTGEVIGVFGDVVPKANPGLLNGFESGIKVNNLIKMEETLARLRPPKWPSAFFEEQPSLDRQARAQQGADLFKANCANCHAPIARTDLTTVIKLDTALFDGSVARDGKIISGPTLGSAFVSTDVWMACNAVDYKSSSGVLSGFSHAIIAPNGLGTESAISELLRSTVAGALSAKKAEIVAGVAAKLIGASQDPVTEGPDAQLRSFVPPPISTDRTAEKTAQIQRCMNGRSLLLGYTSRPLNGIWASPPYLHNGSVPTIYDLLLPSKDRPKVFYLGTREYDPVKMGYVTREDASIGNTFRFVARNDAGVAVGGNSNDGHDYGNSKLTEADRMAIIEYLKTL